jgi:hypothetical protein
MIGFGTAPFASRLLDHGRSALPFLSSYRLHLLARLRCPTHQIDRSFGREQPLEERTPRHYCRSPSDHHRSNVSALPIVRAHSESPPSCPTCGRASKVSPQPLVQLAACREISKIARVIFSTASSIPPGSSTLSQTVDFNASGTSQSSRTMGIIRVFLLILLTIAAFSSSRTHFLVTLTAERTITTAVASRRPSSKILSTKLSSGSISHLSSQTSIPFLRRPLAKGMANLSLSSLA